MQAQVVLPGWELEMESELELEEDLERVLEATEALREKKLERDRDRAEDVAQKAADVLAAHDRSRRPVADQEVCRVSRFLSPSGGLHWEDLRIPGTAVEEPAHY